MARAKWEDYWLFCDNYQKLEWVDTRVTKGETCGGKLYTYPRASAFEAYFEKHGEYPSEPLLRVYKCDRCGEVVFSSQFVIMSVSNPARYTKLSKRMMKLEPEVVFETLTVGVRPKYKKSNQLLRSAGGEK